MIAITAFDFDRMTVRAIERDGEPWFVAADVCAALGIQNPTQAVARLDDDERAMLNIGRGGDANAVSEAGLYTLALRCRDAMTPGAAAHRFRKWVTSEVLPALRKHGRYGASAADTMKALADPAALRTMLLGYAEKVLALEATTERQAGEIAVLAPQAAALDRIATAGEGDMSITAAAKALQVGPRELRDWLRSRGWVYHRVGGDGWLGMQSKVDLGYLTHKVGTAEHANGARHAYRQVLVTPKGLARLATLLGDRRAA